MRIKFWDRLLVALEGLLITLTGISLFVYGIGVLPFKLDLPLLKEPLGLWQRVAIVGAAVVLFALGLHSISILFRRKREKGFILQQTEFGDMSISMKALENMVRRCVDAYDELTVNAISIFRQRDGIVVELRITLRSGVNIPITVNALQKQIKQYITSCSGVDVQRVRVLVETDTAKLMAPAPSPAPAPVVEPPVVVEEPEPEKQKEGFASRFFHHKEEPSTYTATEPEAPVVEAQPAPAAEEPPVVEPEPEKQKEGFASRFFHHKEEPSAYTASEPEAPVAEEAPAPVVEESPAEEPKPEKKESFASRFFHRKEEPVSEPEAPAVEESPAPAEVDPLPAEDEIQTDPIVEAEVAGDAVEVLPAQEDKEEVTL